MKKADVGAENHSMSEQLSHATTTVPCWYCQHVPQEYNFFCDQCHKVQPPRPNHNLFHILGLPESVAIDTEKLEQAYLQVSSKCHPDLYNNKTNHEKLYATQLTVVVNEAYNKLTNFGTRVEYILHLHGISTQQNNAYTTDDHELLSEVMHDQELLEDSNNSTEVLTLQQNNADKILTIKQKLIHCINNQEFMLAQSTLYRYRYYENFAHKVQRKIKQLTS